MISFDIFRVVPGELTLPLGFQVELQVLRDLLCDLIFGGEDVSRLAPVLRTPSLPATLDVDQLCADEEGVAPLKDLPSQDCTYSKGAADFLRLLASALEPEDRASRDHAELRRL